jgi:hypothetical protein
MRKEKKYHFIYKTTNLLSGRYYIGMHSTDNLEDGYLGSGTYLRRAIKKYGKLNFNREIVEFCKTRVELKSREIQIVNLQEIANENCMNLKVGGVAGDGPQIGYCHSLETKQKMSDAAMGKKKSPDHCKNMSSARIGTTHSESTLKKMSESHKNITTETRDKMSKSQLGVKNNFFGKTHTNEVRELIKKARTGSKASAETKLKMKKSAVGHVCSDETREKISKSNSKKQKIIKCPYCSKTGGISTMKQRHIKTCKLKE